MADRSRVRAGREENHDQIFHCACAAHIKEAPCPIDSRFLTRTPVRLVLVRERPYTQEFVV